MTNSEPRQRRLADYPAQVEVPTRWSDQDTYQHVNNAVYVMLIDTAVNKWLIENSDVDVRGLPARGVVVHGDYDYLRQITFPEVATVALRLSRAGRSSVTYDVAVFTPNHQEPAAVATFVHVYVDAETFAAVPIPPEIERALAALKPIGTP